MRAKEVVTAWVVAFNDGDEDGERAITEWRDPLSLRGCGGFASCEP